MDAAVAATLAAFVAEPVLTGPFGGGFAMVAGPGLPAVALDFFAEVPGRGLSPAKGDPDLDFVSVEISFGPATQQFHCGRGSVAVPLLLPGLIDLHERYGRMPMPDVVAPSLELARTGVTLSAQLGPILEILEPILRLTPPADRLFAPAGRILRAGERFSSDGLAHLLEGLAEGARPGEAELLGAFGPPAGRVTRADLDAARPMLTEPIVLPMPGGHVAHLTPPPSSGGLLIGFGLRLLESVPASVWKDECATAEAMLAVQSVTNQARREVLDPALERGEVDGIVDAFLGDGPLDRWRPAFERETREGPVPMPPQPPAHGDTTHVSVMDGDGFTCGITHSNGEGCGWIVPGMGAHANNFLGEEDLHPSGFHHQPPGSRLTTMMAPTLVTQGDTPVLAMGSGGSNRIRTAILQVLTLSLLGGYELHEAVGAPRIHYEGGVLYVERHGTHRSLGEEVLNSLRGRVSELVVFEETSMFFGGVHAVGRGGVGAGDARRGGAVSRA